MSWFSITGYLLAENAFWGWWRHEWDGLLWIMHLFMPHSPTTLHSLHVLGTWPPIMHTSNHQSTAPVSLTSDRHGTYMYMYMVIIKRGNRSPPNSAWKPGKRSFEMARVKIRQCFINFLQIFTRKHWSYLIFSILEFIGYFLSTHCFTKLRDAQLLSKV